MSEIRSKRTHVVLIQNQKLTLRTEADEGYVKEISQCVEEKIRSVMNQASASSIVTIVLTACLNLADELHQERKKRGELLIQAGQRIQSLIEGIDLRLHGGEKDL